MNPVTLRAVRDSDLDHFFAHQQDADAQRMAAFIAEDPSDRTAFDAHWTKIRAQDTIDIRTIESEGDVVGHVASFVADGWLEITYWIDRAAWGRGIATDALHTFLQTVATERPIYARCATDNDRSTRVLEKCGFTKIADERGYANARGAEIDETVWRLGMPWRFGERRVASIGANLQDIARAAAGDEASEEVRTQYIEIAIEQATGRTIVIDPWTLPAVSERHNARLQHHHAVRRTVNAGLILLGLASCLLAALLPTEPWALGAACAVVVVLIVGVVRELRRFDRRATRRTLREYGVPICLRCGYLADNPSGGGVGPRDPCPECGDAPTLALGSRLRTPTEHR